MSILREAEYSIVLEALDIVNAKEDEIARQWARERAGYKKEVFQKSVEEKDSWRESPFTDKVFDSARIRGASLTNQTDVLAAILDESNPELAGIFPDGNKDLDRIKDSLSIYHQKHESLSGSVLPSGRTLSIFENAQERVSQKGGLPNALGYMVSLLREEIKGPSEVTLILENLGLNPVGILRSITDIESC